MKRFAVLLCLFSPLCALPVCAETLVATVPAAPPTIYVSAQDGFQSAISAAFIKKHVAASILAIEDKAEYTLKAAPVNSKDETGAGKVARCIFLNCAGMNGFSSVSVELIRNKDSAVIWAYQVRKANSGPLGIQSMSEAIAKHLQHDYLDKHKEI